MFLQHHKWLDFLVGKRCERSHQPLLFVVDLIIRKKVYSTGMSKVTGAAVVGGKSSSRSSNDNDNDNTNDNKMCATMKRTNMSHTAKIRD